MTTTEALTLAVKLSRAGFGVDVRLRQSHPSEVDVVLRSAETSLASAATLEAQVISIVGENYTVQWDGGSYLEVKPR